MKRLFGALSMLSLTLACSDASAQPTLATQGVQLPAPQAVETLAPVVVIGTTPLPGIGIPADRLPFASQTAPEEGIRASGAIALGEFLHRRFGSVFINEMQGNPFQPDVSYRGYTASPLLGTPQGLSLYVDGIRLNQPFGDVVSWDLIPRSAIARVDLVPGSNPLFGLNTLGGAISVVTKDGITYPGTSFQATVGSYGRREVEVETGGQNERGLSWFGTAVSFRERGWRDSSPSRVQQTFGKLGWKAGATRLSLTATGASTSLYGNGLQDQQLLDRRYASVYTVPDITRKRAGLVAFEGVHRFNDTLSLSTVAFFRRITTRTFNGDINDESLEEDLYSLSANDRAALTRAGISLPGTTAPAATPFPSLRCVAQALQGDEPGLACNGLLNRSDQAQKEAGISAQLSGRFLTGSTNHDVSVGAGLTGSTTRFNQSTELGYIRPDRSITGVGAFADGSGGGTVEGEPLDTRVDLHARTTTWSVFGTDTVTLAPALYLTASARYNHTQVRNVDQLVRAPDPASLDARYTFSRFNPALGLAWNPNPIAKFYAGYSEGSRTPTAIELGCANEANPCKLPNAMAGDPPLRQVVTHTFEAGWRGRLDHRTTWRAGVFRADNDDDIVFVAAGVSGFGHFRNIGKTRRQGVELEAATAVGPLELGLSWTWLDARFRSAETLQGAGNSSNDEGPGLDGNIAVRSGDRLPLVPRQMAKATARLAVGSGVTVDLGLIAMAGASARGNENGLHEPDDTYYLGAGRSAGYAVLNFGAAWQVNHALSFSARIDNLLDRRYATAGQLGATGFISDGRFVAQPFPTDAEGNHPLRGSTFFAPGAPRRFYVGARYSFQ